jgi:hypothetical protein
MRFSKNWLLGDHAMKPDFRVDMRRHFESQETDNLIKIYEENDREQYQDCVFEVISQILTERGAMLPRQKKPKTGPPKGMGSEFELLRKGNFSSADEVVKASHFSTILGFSTFWLGILDAISFGLLTRGADGFGMALLLFFVGLWLGGRVLPVRSNPLSWRRWASNRNGNALGFFIGLVLAIGILMPAIASKSRAGICLGLFLPMAVAVLTGVFVAFIRERANFEHVVEAYGAWQAHGWDERSR